MNSKKKIICTHTCKNDNALYVKNSKTCICRLCGGEVTYKNWLIYTIQRDQAKAIYSISSIRNRHLTKSQQKKIRKICSLSNMPVKLLHLEMHKYDDVPVSVGNNKITGKYFKDRRDL